MAAILILRLHSDVTTVTNENQPTTRHKNFIKHVAAKTLWL